MTIELARAVRPQTISEFRQLAEDAAASGFFPTRRPQEALVILMTGAELGLKPMQAMRSIYVVNGKPVISADMLVAAVRASGACESWRVVVSTAERCEIHTRRRGESADEVGVWTRADAERAGVYRKPGPWQQYPDRMLRHRCASDLARRVYPDVCLGVYVPGELDDDRGEPERAYVVQSGPAESAIVEAEHAEPTPLEKLRDDLASAETIEAIKASFATHAEAIDALDDGEGGPNTRKARELMCDRVIALGLARTKTEADALMKNPEKPGVVDEFERAIDAIADESTNVGAAIVEACVRWKAKLAKLAAPWNAQAKTYAAQAYGVAMGIPSAEDARERLTAAVRDHGKPTPPDGGQPTGRKRSAPAADAQGPANEGGEVTGPMARAALAESAPYAKSADQWAAHLAAKTRPHDVAGSWAKHAPAFGERTSSLRASRLRAAVGRHMAVSGMAEAESEACLLATERRADEPARAAGRSEIAARRELRERTERAGMREVAQAYANAGERDAA